VIEKIPVFTRIQIINEDGRYTNSHIRHDAQDGDILAFGMAVNGLQFRTPAQKYIKIQREELKAA